MKADELATRGYVKELLDQQLESLRALLEGAPREAMLSVAEVAQELQITRKTVERLISEKQLIASQVGRQWRIRRQHLDAYLEANRNRKAG